MRTEGSADGSERPCGCQRAGTGDAQRRRNRKGIRFALPTRWRRARTRPRGATALGELGQLVNTLLAVAAFAVLASFIRSAEAAQRVAVLDIELLKADYFPDHDRITSDERGRLDMVAALIRDRLRAEGYDAVPAAQTKAAVRAADPGQYLHDCNGCERDIARDVGADWVAVGWIQIVSYLIVNLNVMVIDVESGAPVARAFVDLRGNTERSWRRATLYLLDNILVDRLAQHR